MLATIKWKHLLVILLAVGLIGFGAHVFRKYRFHHSVNIALQNAIAAEKAGDYHQAIKTFRQYLAAVPDDSESWVRYALLQCKVADNSTDVERYQLLEKVLIRTPRNRALRRKAAALGIKLGYFSQAIGHLEHLRARESNDVALLHMLANCETSLEQYKSAQNTLGNIVINDPNDIDAYMHHAQLLKTKLNDPESADAIIEFMILQNPLSSYARLVAGRYYLASRQIGIALNNVTFAINVLLSDDIDLYLLAAKISFLQNELQGSKHYLQQVHELYPNDIEPALLLAELAIRQNRSDEAVSYLTPFIKKAPPDKNIRWSMVQIFIEANRYAPATMLAREEGTSGYLRRYLEARIHMRNKNWSNAKMKLNSLDQSELPTQIVKVIQYNIARCNAALQNHELELSAYQRSLEIDPTWVPARLGYAEALATLGEYRRACIEFAKLKEHYPQASIKLIELQLQQQMQLPPEQRNWSAITQLMSKLTDDAKSSFAFKLVQAKVLVAQRKFKLAECEISTIIKAYPDRVDPWLLRFQIAVVNGNDALHVLKEAEDIIGKRVDLDIASIYFYLRFDSLSLPSRLGELYEAGRRYTIGDRVKLYSALAHAFFLIGNEGKAEQALVSVANLDPNQLQVRRMLVEQTVERNDLLNARKWFTEIRELDNGGPIAILCAALVHYGEARNGDLSAINIGQDCVKQAIQIKPKWFRPVTLLGRFCELGNDVSGALTNYHKAIALGENRLFVFRRVLMLMISAQQYSRATEVLRKLPRKTLARSEFRSLAMQVYLRSESGTFSNSLHDILSERTFKKESEYFDQLLMAQISRRAGKVEEADFHFRRAISLNKEDPTGWIALVRFLANHNQKMAHVELENARNIVHAKDRNLVIGLGYEALGRNREAEQVFKELLHDRSNDGAIVQTVAAFYLRRHRLAQAEILLRRLLLFKGVENADNVSWARKWLAVTLAFRGGRKRFEEAKMLLEKTEELERSGSDALLYKALVLASRPEYREESLRLFESGKLKASELTPTIRLLIAQLYESEGNWSSARGKYLSVLGEVDRNPVYIAKFIDACLRHGRANECVAWLDRLKELAPDSRTTLSLEVRTLIAIGERKRALKAIRACLSNPNPQLDLAALLLETLNHHDEAEATLREFVMTSKNSKDVLVLARFLGRRGQISEALKMCDNSQQKCTHTAICSAYASIVRHPMATHAQLGHVEQRIREYVKKNPNQVVFSILLAEVSELQGRVDTAIHLYKAVLSRSPGNIVALNNLAYLYAHQPNQISDGLKLIKKAIDYAGPLANLRDTRAVLLMQSNRFEEAENDLEIAVRKGPGPLKYFHLAQIHLHNMKFRKARGAIAKAKDHGLNLNKLPRFERKKYLSVISKLK